MAVSQMHLEVFRLINDGGKLYPSLNPFVVFIAEYMVYVLGMATIAYWFTRPKKNRMMVIHALMAFTLAEILGKMAGQVYSHYQPFAELPDVSVLVAHEIDNSFPSDHTILFFSVGVSFWLARKKETWVWPVIALLVGISRVWAGIHYPIDVVAAGFLGTICAVLVNRAAPKWSFLTQFLAKDEQVPKQGRM